MSLEDRIAYLEACTRCSQCKFVPVPASREFSSICPSIDHGQFHAFSGGGKVITSYALHSGVAEITPKVVESVYACTMCGGCDVACKANMGEEVEPLDSLYELRAHVVREGAAPEALARMVDALRHEGSHLGPRAERSFWAEGLGLKDAIAERVDVLLHVDGENAFDRAQWPQLRALVRMLQAAAVDFGIAYDAESDSGGFAYDLGFQDDARELARHQQRLLRQSGASILLCAGAGAYAAFRGHYPRLGIGLDGVRIVHSTEFVAELLESGRLALKASAALTATYHDPCRLGRLSEPVEPWSGKMIDVLNILTVPDSTRPVRFGVKGQYDAPRRLLRHVEGLELVEMERSREFAYCCGAGSGVAEAYPAMGDKAALSRLDEARKTGASCVVTACGGCQRHLAATAARHSVDIEVRGIFEFLANAI
jgi:Fe-S oxidoreductase